MTDKKLSDRIQIDDANNVVTIDGCRYSGPALDFFTKSSPEGFWYQLVRSEGSSVMTAKVRTEEGFK